VGSEWVAGGFSLLGIGLGSWLTYSVTTSTDAKSWRRQQSQAAADRLRTDRIAGLDRIEATVSEAYQLAFTTRPPSDKDGKLGRPEPEVIAKAMITLAKLTGDLIASNSRIQSDDLRQSVVALMEAVMAQVQAVRDQTTYQWEEVVNAVQRVGADIGACREEALST
jgi:hypothetical protein